MTLLRSAPVEKNEPIHRLCLDNLDKHPHGEFSATRHDTSAVRPHQVQRLAIRIHIYELGPQFSAALHNGPGTRLGAARWCRCAALGPIACGKLGCVWGSPPWRMQAVFRAYDTTKLYRDLKLRGAIIRDKQLILLPERISCPWLTRTHARAHTHSHTPMPAHVHTHAHTHAQTQTAILLAEHIAHRTRARAGIHS